MPTLIAVGERDRMPGECFTHPRLVAIADECDPDRSDLDLYLCLAADIGACRVLDIGSGTGVLAMLLADRGAQVVGVDPAAASVEYARARAGGDRATFLVGTAEDALPVPGGPVDLVTMTANAAQELREDAELDAFLRTAQAALRPGGRLAFEVRDPARRAWEGWTREASEWEGATSQGRLRCWVETTDVTGDLVTFRWYYEFADGERLTSDSTLRFRERGDIEAAVARAGLRLLDVLDAPDRPGLEWVFLAERP